MKNIVIGILAVSLAVIIWLNNQPSSPKNSVKSTADTSEKKLQPLLPEQLQSAKTLPVADDLKLLVPTTQQLAENSSTVQNSNESTIQNAQPTQKTHLPFDQQDVDYLWADQITTEIQDLFILNENINHLSIKETECKATQCFFSVYFGEALGSIEQAQIIGKIIKEKWPEYTFYLTSHPETGVMKMEISRFNEN